MYLTGIPKQMALLGMLRSSALRKLPFPALLRMRRFLAGEKLTHLDGRFVVNSFLPPYPGPAFESLGAGIQSLLHGKPVPVSAYVAVTNRCGFQCWHCSKAHRDAEDLSCDEWRRILHDLQELGTSIIGFTGGEPLLRGDLPRLVAAVDSRSSTILFTTGDGLTRERASELKGAGLFGVAVSLDHHLAEVHDQRRGRKGAFAQALGAVRIARETGFYTMIQLVGTSDVVREDTMNAYLALAGRIGVHEIRLLEPMPTGRLMEADKNCCISAGERAGLRSVHVRTNRRRDLPKVAAFAHIEHGDMYGCGAGFQHLYIDAGGNVCPCDFTPVSFGNVTREPLAAVWSRMNAAFARPRRRCFLLQNAGRLRKAFRGTLPIPYEEAREVCCFANGGELPGYYRALGLAECSREGGCDAGRQPETQIARDGRPRIAVGAAGG